jgi:hypothetical protein
MGILARGSTGCEMPFSSSSPSRLELDRKRVFAVLPVSALCNEVIREDTEPRWRTECCCC